MELRQLWRIARRRWWLIALPALAALAAAAYSYVRTPPGGGFAAAIRFTGAEPPAGDAAGYEDSSYYPWLASEYVVNALTDWVKTSTFADEVSARLAAEGMDIPAGALHGAFASENERSVMVLHISWPDADQLESIAGAASAVLSERSGAYFPQIGQAGLRVVALDKPSIVPVPPPLSARLQPLIRLALGLGAGIFLAFLVEYLDPALHERRDLEALGLVVLAEVPRHHTGRRPVRR